MKKAEQKQVNMATQWREPAGYERAGYGTWKRPPAPYDRFMEGEGVPIHRGVGVRRVQDLPMGPWRRLGGRGAFIQLYGTEGIWGAHLVEIPPAQALTPERHLYEEILFVVEGRGATEVWAADGDEREVFEWQAGALHLEEGGHAIPYWDEDPRVRQEWEAAIRREGAEIRMDEAFYRQPVASEQPIPSAGQG